MHLHTHCQGMYNASRTSHRAFGYKSPLPQILLFFTTQRVLPAFSLLAEMLDVLATMSSAFARPNTKHSFEPLHNSYMSGQV